MQSLPKGEAREEGFNEIVDLFDGVEKLKKNMKKDTRNYWKILKVIWYFQRMEIAYGKCLNCGHIVIGKRHRKFALSVHIHSLISGKT